MKRVWVLGAGFSRSLGGPLLPDLLSLNSRDELRARYPNLGDVYDGPEATIIYRLFHHGRRHPEGNPLGPTYKVRKGVNAWQDAEHFLDVLDSAQVHGPLKRRLLEMWTRIQVEGLETVAPFDSVQALLRAAQRLLAAECCGFMQEADTSLERWEPYVTWASRLTAADTVITFNYDLVAETAAAGAQKLEQPGRGLCVATGELKSCVDRATQANQPILLKLHGSVDWKHTPAKYAREGWVPFTPAEPEFAINQGLDAILSIATPGPTKGTLASTHLKAIWDLARDRLCEADQVLFVGYRFPPSDSQARSNLLGAIASNPPRTNADHADRAKEPRPLGLHIVLGVLGDSDAAAARLSAMLVFAAEKSGRLKKPGIVPYEITRHNMFAEDFLSVANIRGAPA